MGNLSGEGQIAPTALEDLPEQSKRAKVLTAVPEPALLPGAVVPVAGPPLVGGSARETWARPTGPEPSTHKLNARAASAPSPRPRSFNTQRLHRPVAT